MYSVAGHGVGERGRVAHVVVPDDGLGLGAVAAADRAGEHPAAGLPAEIGLGDVAGDARLDNRLARDREAALDLLQRLELAIREAARAVGRPGRDDAEMLGGGGFVLDRQPGPDDQIVGHALLRDILEDREVEQPRRAVEIAAKHVDIIVEHVFHRAAQPVFQLGFLMPELLELGGLPPLPQNGLGLKERVQGGPGQPCPAERHADRVDAVAKGFEHADDVGLRQGLVDKPFVDSVHECRVCHEEP